jgi:hypothetical protein
LSNKRKYVIKLIIYNIIPYRPSVICYIPLKQLLNAHATVTCKTLITLFVGSMILIMAIYKDRTPYNELQFAILTVFLEKRFQYPIKVCKVNYKQYSTKYPQKTKDWATSENMWSNSSSIISFHIDPQLYATSH